MSSDSSDFLHELQEIFLQESAEHLTALEAYFLEFEYDTANRSLIEKIFRVMHTLKGSGNAVGFENLGGFAHVCENLLVKIMHESLLVTSEVIDILLQSNDRLKLIHRSLSSDREAKIDNNDLIEKINRTIQQKGDSPQQQESECSGFGVFDETPSTDQEAKHEEHDRFVLEKRAENFAPKEPKEKDSCDGGEKKDESIRLPLKKIDDLLNNFGEQVILQAILEHGMRDISANKDLINKTISSLGKITYDLQQTAIGLRMVSLRMFFNSMKRTARDTAKSLGKPCHFAGSGEETELDKTIVDNLSSVIVHVIRNSIDHGIETAQVREQRGKPAEGTLKAEAFNEGSSFVLRISDDGGGINKEAVLNKARKKGLIPQDKHLADEDIYRLIFMSGFSTKEEATEVSGRGVGMDAVKTIVDDMRGILSVNSTEGVGMVLTIKLPLTLAIFNGILLRMGDKRYVVPSSEIKEVFRFDPAWVREIDSDSSLLHKGDHALPLIGLNHLTGEKKKEAKDQSRRIALIVHKFNKEYAIEVDDIVGQQRIVQKRLGTEIEDAPGLSGGAIMGDGNVALILNLGDLISRYFKLAA